MTKGKERLPRPSPEGLAMTRGGRDCLTQYTLPCKIMIMGRYKGKRMKWDGDSIHALRKHMGWTQKMMAEEMGTRQQTVSEWEKGMYKPRGTSSTLLSIIAERAEFTYDAGGDSEGNTGDS